MKNQFKTPKIINTNISSDMKQFLLTLLATTISIVLTFGTSAIIEKHQKKAAKKEMVMMIIYDFDKTIEQVQVADSAFRLASKTEQEIALHPEYFDSLQIRLYPAITLISNEFSETTEKIFSSNIETVNTISDVNFINEVSSFYNMRHLYQDLAMNVFKEEISGLQGGLHLETLFDIDFPSYYLTTRSFLESFIVIRNRCIQMMNISEEEQKKFSEQHIKNENKKNGSVDEQIIMEMYEAEEIIEQAKEKLKQGK